MDITPKYYSDYRSELKSGDVVAWNQVPDNLPFFTKMVVWVVTKALRSPYYHIGVVWRTNNRVLIIEASPPRCRIDVLSRRGSFVHLKTGLKWSKAVENDLLEYVGKPYSIWEAVLVPFKIKAVKNRAWYCSELVKDFFNKEGMYVEGISPEDVLISLAEETGNYITPVVMDHHVERTVAEDEKEFNKIAKVAEKTESKIIEN